MSNLKRMTDASVRLAGSKSMQVSIPYSLAYEIAEKADRALSEGWTVDDNDSHYVLTAPSGHDAVVYKQRASDDSSNDDFLRELAQELGQGAPPSAVKPEPIFLVWTGADSRAAVAEGWDVFSVEGMVDRVHLAIQRLDEDERLDDDAHAIWYVYNKAVSERSALHRKALALTLQCGSYA